MESSLRKSIASLSVGIRQLAESRDRERARADSLEAENDELRMQLKEARQDLHRARLDVEFLTLSHKLAASPQALAEARKTVRRMISKVDKAIAILTDDPEF